MVKKSSPEHRRKSICNFTDIIRIYLMKKLYFLDFGTNMIISWVVSIIPLKNNDKSVSGRFKFSDSFAASLPTVKVRS